MCPRSRFPADPSGTDISGAGTISSTQAFATTGNLGVAAETEGAIAIGATLATTAVYTGPRRCAAVGVRRAGFERVARSLKAL